MNIQGPYCHDTTELWVDCCVREKNVEASELGNSLKKLALNRLLLCTQKNNYRFDELLSVLWTSHVASHARHRKPLIFHFGNSLIHVLLFATADDDMSAVDSQAFCHHVAHSTRYVRTVKFTSLH